MLQGLTVEEPAGSDCQMDVDKENIPENCTLAGDPLMVSFLTIAKLERDAVAGPNCGGEWQYISQIFPLVEFTFVPAERFNLETHLMPSSEARELLYR